MTTLFWICTVVGVVLLVVGIVLGDFLEFDLDLDTDLDVDGILSAPVIGGFLAAFGAGGLIVSSVTDEAPVPSVAGGLVAGVGVGWLAVRFTRSVMNMATDATVTSGDFMGQVGRVVTPLAVGASGEARGEVMIQQGGQPQKLTALGEVPMATGDRAVVIEVVSATTVRVIPMSEILEDPS